MIARALINVPQKAKRGEIIEIKTLISHIMETGFRHGTNGAVDPARHHHDVHLPLQRRGDLLDRCSIRRSPPIRSSTFTTVATESGTLDVHVGRRQRLLGDRRRRRSRWRMTRAAPARRARCSRRLAWLGRAACLRHIVACPPPKSRSTERRSGYDIMSREHARRCRTTTRQSRRCSRCSTARRCGARKAGATDKACADCHGDAAQAMRGVAARYPAFNAAQGPPDRSRAAHQPLPHRAAEGAAVRL